MNKRGVAKGLPELTYIHTGFDLRCDDEIRQELEHTVGKTFVVPE